MGSTSTPLTAGSHRKAEDSSFPRSAWERTSCTLCVMDARLALATQSVRTAFPRRAWEREASLSRSTFAVDLASRRPHRALLLVSTFTSIPDMAQKQYPWLPARWLVRNRFESLDKIASCPMPILIAHGTADEFVPFAQGERLFAAAQEPKQFFPMEG
jgi:fermentation-respiration switch protein FrsA (DUF1100 family)